jgi:DNA replication protein DnaC
MINQTRKLLFELGLSGMAEAYENQVETASYVSMGFDDRLSLLLEQEKSDRDNRRYERLRKQAKFKHTSAYMENIDYRQKRGLDQAMMQDLQNCEWIHSGLDIIFTGPAGTGKTWLACSLGHQACRNGLKVQFHRLTILLEELSIAHVDGTFHKKLKQLQSLDLLILDDFGVGSIDPKGRGDLLEIIDGRTGAKSTIITSQLPVGKWHEYLSTGNPTAADSILDRITNSSIRFELFGESMRKLQRP